MSSTPTHRPRHRLAPLGLLLLALLVAAGIWLWDRGGLGGTLSGSHGDRHLQELHRRFLDALAAEEAAYFAALGPGDRVGLLAGELEAGCDEPERRLAELESAESVFLPMLRAWVTARRALDAVRLEAEQQYPGDAAFQSPERETWKSGPLARQKRRDGD
jgi:hypothetical protein